MHVNQNTFESGFLINIGLGTPQNKLRIPAFRVLQTLITGLDLCRGLTVRPQNCKFLEI